MVDVSCDFVVQNDVCKNLRLILNDEIFFLGNCGRIEMLIQDLFFGMYVWKEMIWSGG